MQLLKEIYATPTLFLSKKFPTGLLLLNGLGPPRQKILNTAYKSEHLIW